MTLFRSMTPDKDSQPIDWHGPLVNLQYPAGALCEDCGSIFYAGDWPWCGGVAAKHRRDH